MRTVVFAFICFIAGCATRDGLGSIRVEDAVVSCDGRLRLTVEIENRSSEPLEYLYTIMDMPEIDLILQDSHGNDISIYCHGLNRMCEPESLLQIPSQNTLRVLLEYLVDPDSACLGTMILSIKDPFHANRWVKIDVKCQRGDSVCPSLYKGARPRQVVSVESIRARKSALHESRLSMNPISRKYLSELKEDSRE